MHNTGRNYHISIDRDRTSRTTRIGFTLSQSLRRIVQFGIFMCICWPWCCRRFSQHRRLTIVFRSNVLCVVSFGIRKVVGHCVHVLQQTRTVGPADAFVHFDFIQYQETIRTLHVELVRRFTWRHNDQMCWVDEMNEHRECVPTERKTEEKGKTCCGMCVAWSQNKNDKWNDFFVGFSMFCVFVFISYDFNLIPVVVDTLSIMFNFIFSEERKWIAKF